MDTNKTNDNNFNIQPDIIDSDEMHAWENNIRQPEKSLSIWRYMDFGKFMYLLENSCLFFPRIDLLGDNFEGSTTKPHYETFRSRFQNSSDYTWINQLNNVMRTHCFVTCWHLSEFENAALWKLYGLENRSIAIRTTYKKLYSLKNVKTGLIDYADYSYKSLEMPVFEAFAMMKRNCFSYENEVRGIIRKQNIQSIQKDGKSFVNYLPNIIPGIPVSIDLSDFIDEIIISPYSETWFIELIKKILHRYNCSISVKQSELTENPSFEGYGFPLDSLIEDNKQKDISDQG